MKAIIENAPLLPGIFSMHCLKSKNGLVKMSQYSDQINENVVNDESPLDDNSALVQIGSFVIIPYQFQTSKSTVTKKLVAVVMNVKACIHYFLSNFYFSPNDSPSKTMKNVFYFIQKARFIPEILKLLYLHLPLFFPCQPLL